MLRVIPIDLDIANQLVSMWHRHHKPVRGYKFALGVIDNEGLVHGGVIVGRPSARKIDFMTTLEVTRLVTDGTKNACSILYAAAACVAREMGYCKIITYILESEDGISLVSAGWKFESVTAGQQWKHTDGRPRRTDQPICDKKRWGKILNNSEPPRWHLPVTTEINLQISLPIPCEP